MWSVVLAQQAADQGSVQGRQVLRRNNGGLGSRPHQSGGQQHVLHVLLVSCRREGPGLLQVQVVQGVGSNALQGQAVHEGVTEEVFVAGHLYQRLEEQLAMC